MDFFLLILLTGIILIRPEELVQELLGTNLYLWTILLTTAVCLPRLGNLLTWPEISRRSICFCTLGMFAAVITSTITTKNYDRGGDILEGFVKVSLFYLLAISILDTPSRLSRYIGWLVPLICLVALFTAMNYHEWVTFPDAVGKTLEERRTDPVTQDTVIIRRAVYSGIFNDPNDLCLILVLGMLCSLFQMLKTPDLSAKVFWCLPLLPLLYVMTLTGSRGGMLTLVSGIAALGYAFVGFRIGVPLAAVGGVALLALLGGRGSEISGGGTARQRLDLWAEGISSLFNYPSRIPFGLGPGWYQYEQGEGLLAHNSFVQAYVEYGIMGGGFFLIAFLTALLVIDRLPKREHPHESDWLWAMRPAMLAIVVSYAVGCFSLSAELKLPTYLVLGLATAYIELTGPPPERYQINRGWFRWAVPAMIAGLVCVKLMTQFLGHRI